MKLVIVNAPITVDREEINNRHQGLYLNENIFYQNNM